MAEPRPIPTSLAVRWRDFRHEVAPYLVFGVVLVATFLLWRGHTGRGLLVGRAETEHIPVSPAKGGVVTALKVDLLQRVKRGDVIAEVIPADVEAERASLMANLESLRAQMLQNLDRNSVNFQQFRLDWMRRKLELASAQVDLQFAESEYRRMAGLHDSHIVSDADFEAKRSARDVLQVKVDTLRKISADLEQEMNRPRPSGGTTDESPAERAVAAGTLLLQKQLEAQAAATILRAPIDGIVSAISRQVGENASAGQPVVILGALRPARIVGFARQPLRAPPRPGELVRVTSRASRRSADARVLQVGAQLEPIDPSLLPFALNSHVAEAGLPLLIELPRDLDLAPGEIVDLTLAR